MLAERALISPRYGSSARLSDHLRKTHHSSKKNRICSSLQSGISTCQMKVGRWDSGVALGLLLLYTIPLPVTLTIPFVIMNNPHLRQNMLPGSCRVQHGQYWFTRSKCSIPCAPGHRGPKCDAGSCFFSRLRNTCVPTQSCPRCLNGRRMLKRALVLIVLLFFIVTPDVLLDGQGFRIFGRTRSPPNVSDGNHTSVYAEALLAWRSRTGRQAKRETHFS